MNETPDSEFDSIEGIKDTVYLSRLFDRLCSRSSWLDFLTCNQEIYDYFGVEKCGKGEILFIELEKSGRGFIVRCKRLELKNEKYIQPITLMSPNGVLVTVKVHIVDGEAVEVCRLSYEKSIAYILEMVSQSN